MQVKTFTGPSTQDVLAQVKAELGSDAIILASRELNGNSRPGSNALREVSAFPEAAQTRQPCPRVGRNGTRNGHASKDTFTH